MQVDAGGRLRMWFAERLRQADQLTQVARMCFEVAPVAAVIDGFESLYLAREHSLQEIPGLSIPRAVLPGPFPLQSLRITLTRRFAARSEADAKWEVIPRYHPAAVRFDGQGGRSSPLAPRSRRR